MNPTTRFLATAENCTFPTQIGKVIYSSIDRTMRDLTWGNASGVSFDLFGRRWYVPVFWWRGRK